MCALTVRGAQRSSDCRRETVDAARHLHWRPRAPSWVSMAPAGPRHHQRSLGHLESDACSPSRRPLICRLCPGRLFFFFFFACSRPPLAPRAHFLRAIAVWPPFCACVLLYARWRDCSGYIACVRPDRGPPRCCPLEIGYIETLSHYIYRRSQCVTAFVGAADGREKSHS